jgi:DNA polymerase V
LVDCNNFYVSCERVFDPCLNGKPVIVLSNNDGCAISRSNEAKLLGIKMGVPAFSIKDVIEKFDVKVFSSNYALYGDMSRRVMSLLSEYAPEMEIYSIDEAFLYFQGIPENALLNHGKKMVHRVGKFTGIPLSLGIAPTKSLAKIANKIAKKQGRDVFIIDKENTTDVLKKFPIEDVWGIGSQHAAFLKKQGIVTAYDFIGFPGDWVRKNLTVVGLRLWEELQSRPSIRSEIETPSKKNICTSLSFGEMQTDFLPLEEAVTAYASRCAEKLRKQKSCAGTLMVFLHTNQFREDLQQYARNIVIHLPVPTNSTLELVHFSKEGLKRIYKKGYAYKKAGIIVSNFVPESEVQQNMFDTTDRKKHASLMKAVDKLNKDYGKETVRIASQGFTQSWKLRQEKLSSRYTTRWSELITINT